MPSRGATFWEMAAHQIDLHIQCWDGILVTGRGGGYVEDEASGRSDCKILWAVAMA